MRIGTLPPCWSRKFLAASRISIARCLYLLESVPLDQPIKGREYLIEKPDELYGFGLARASREARQVREQDRCFLVFIGDYRARALQPACDGGRQDITKQSL